jgi:hypothetical protein
MGVLLGTIAAAVTVFSPVHPGGVTEVDVKIW